MNAIAQRARDAALSLEVKKDGLQQRQSGEWVLRLTIHPNDMPMPVMKAGMGTRYQCVLVELDDNDQPKGGAPAIAPDPAPLPDRARTWNQLSPAQQAGMLCNEPAFARFLRENYPTFYDGTSGPESGRAAECVRTICRVKSRADISTTPLAPARWAHLVSHYRSWQLEPEVVG